MLCVKGKLTTQGAKYPALISFDPKERKPRITWFDGEPIGHLILKVKNFEKFVILDDCFSFGRAEFRVDKFQRIKNKKNKTK